MKPRTPFNFHGVRVVEVDFPLGVTSKITMLPRGFWVRIGNIAEGFTCPVDFASGVDGWIPTARFAINGRL